MTTLILEGWDNYDNGNVTFGSVGSRWFTRFNSPDVRSDTNSSSGGPARTGSKFLRHVNARITGTNIVLAGNELGMHFAIKDHDQNRNETASEVASNQIGTGVWENNAGGIPDNGFFIRVETGVLGNRRHQLCRTVASETTVLGTTTESFAANNWVSHDVTINAAGDWSWQVNGVQEANGTTTPLSNVTVFEMRTGNHFIAYDDLFIRDTPVHVGDVIVSYQTVDTDLTDQDWVPSGGGAGFEDINDFLPSTGDGDFITANTLNDVSAFGFATPTEDIGTVHSVALKYRASKVDAGAAEVTPSLQVSGAGPAYPGQVLTQSIVFYENFADVNPATSLAWAPADLANIEVSFERTI